MEATDDEIQKSLEGGWTKIPHNEMPEFTWVCDCGRRITAQLATGEVVVRCRDCNKLYDYETVSRLAISVISPVVVTHKKPKFMFILIPYGAILSFAYEYYQSHTQCYSYTFAPSTIFCSDPTGQAFVGAAAIAVIGFGIIAGLYWLYWHYLA